MSDAKGGAKKREKGIPKTALDFADRDSEDSDGLMKIPKGKKGLLYEENVDSEQVPSSSTNVKVKGSK